MSDASDLDGEEEVDREVEVLGAHCLQLFRASLRHCRRNTVPIELQEG